MILALLGVSELQHVGCLELDDTVNDLEGVTCRSGTHMSRVISSWLFGFSMQERIVTPSKLEIHVDWSAKIQQRKADVPDL